MVVSAVAGNPVRMMLATDDLGLELLRSEWDPVLLAAGIKVPRMSDKTVHSMRFKAANYLATKNAHTPEAKAKRKAHKLNPRSVAGIAHKQEMSRIIARLQNFGQVQNRWKNK